MELALYDPDGGYYRVAERRPGPRRRLPDRAGGPPDLRARRSPRPVEDVWAALGSARARSRSAEHGAGDRGARRADPRRASRARDPALAAAVRYDPIEIEPRRLEALRDAARRRRAWRPARSSPDDGAPIVGVVVANEVLDALPTHRVVVRDGRLREVLVGWRDGAFVDVEADPSTPALAARLADGGDRPRRRPARRRSASRSTRWVARTPPPASSAASSCSSTTATRRRELYDPVRRATGRSAPTSATASTTTRTGTSVART